MQKHREIQTKSDYLERIRKLDYELNYSKGQIEKLNSQKNQLEKDLKISVNKYTLFEKSIKEQMFSTFFFL